MPSDERDPSGLPEGALVASEALPAPVVSKPESLAEALRLLQTRLPEFTQLSVEEQRSMGRAAHLDPAVIDAGLHAAAVWEQSTLTTGMSGEEFRELAEDIRRWDEAERELRALLRGVAAANLKRKHRLGKAVLTLYSLLGAVLRKPHPDDVHLRPYYDDMRRAVLAAQKKKGKD